MANGDRMESARDEVIDYLSAQYSHDFLNEEEFERRVGLAHDASQINGLVSVVLDLPGSQGLINRITAPAVRGEQTPPAQTARPAYDSPATAGQSRSVVAIFSGSDLRGEFDVPETVNVLSVFGGSNIDLREAHLPSGDIYIHALSVFGGTNVIVPEGVNVEVRGIGIFGGFSHSRRAQKYDNAPRIIVDGVAFFGGVDVKVARRRRGRDEESFDRYR